MGTHPGGRINPSSRNRTEEIINSNQHTFSLPDVVKYYIFDSTLQRGEEKIFSLLNAELSHMSMLDIGVGAGRTTSYLAGKVKEYIAIDYSVEMIATCKKRFKGNIPEENFIVGDARYLDRLFSLRRFDFILFSFNGIDYTNYEERMEILNQIKAMLNPCGCFCFSSHNIQCIDEWRKFNFRKNVFALVKQLLFNRKRLAINSEQIKQAIDADYILLNDGAHDFGLTTCYSRPANQVKILRQTGYTRVHAFNISAEELKTEREMNLTTDRWIYYLCFL